MTTAVDLGRKATKQTNKLCTLVAYIANNMDPDQTAPLELIVFASMVKLV